MASLILPSLILLFFILTKAESAIDIFQILKDGGEYNTFIKFLKETEVGKRINYKATKSSKGVTVLAPTDNAFSNLTNITFNDEKKVKLLINYHVISNFYTFDNLQTVHNPVETLATGKNGEPLGLNFIGKNNQLNVSSGSVVTNVYEYPIFIGEEDPTLAVYKLDQVLVPSEFTDDSAHKTIADEPSPTTTSTTTKPNDAKRINVGILCLISGVFFMGTLS